MPLHLDNKSYNIPGLTIHSYLDKSPLFGRSRYKSKRTTGLNSIVIHTNRGMTPKEVLENRLEDKKTDLLLAKYQAKPDTRKASWDFSVDKSICQSNDPIYSYTWSANQMNKFCLGIEMCQQHDSPWNIYEDTLDSTVLLVDTLTYILGIQRQLLCFDIHSKSNWNEKVIERTISSPNKVYGLIGHRNCSSKKGPGDPGNTIFDKLKEAGYECFDMNLNQDINTWKKRQKDMGLKTQDGLPGKATQQAVKGYLQNKSGLWVTRPIDSYLDSLPQ